MIENGTKSAANLMTREEGVKLIEEVLGLNFFRKELLLQALTHRSSLTSAKMPISHLLDNERLEYLGDSVLGLAVADLLMQEFPEENEGELSLRRSRLVNENTLAEVAKEFRINEVIRVGKGERMSGGPERPRILACALEAIFGAAFLDQGFPVARELVWKMMQGPLGKMKESPEYRQDYKTVLQEEMQKFGLPAPKYELLAEEGPPHERIFTVGVRLKLRPEDSELSLLQAQGRAKKIAEQELAKNLLEKIRSKAVVLEKPLTEK